MPEPEATMLRRDHLLLKLQANEITRSEVMELRSILAKEKESAQKSGDVSRLVAIEISFAVLAAWLALSYPYF